MILVNYLAAAALFCLGLYTVLSRRNLIKIVMGLSLMESSTYLLLISLAYRRGVDRAGAARPSPAPEPPLRWRDGNVADPVLQNFCLTAIVIGVAVTAVFLSVAVRISQHYRSSTPTASATCAGEQRRAASLLPLAVAIARSPAPCWPRSSARLTAARRCGHLASSRSPLRSGASCCCWRPRVYGGHDITHFWATGRPVLRPTCSATPSPPTPSA